MSFATRTALALLVVCTTACSVVTPIPPSSNLPPPTRHLLPNGVRVVVQEYPAGQAVALQLWVRAGARDENTQELGLAHYLEHMLFKGTSARPTGFIDRDVEGVGGRMNAGTSLDYTYYHMLLPAHRTQSGIETLADISVNASLEESALQSEKRVVLEEMRFGEDSPSRFLVRQLYTAAFPDHPYGRAVIGQPEIVRRLSRDRLLEFYRRYYVPAAFTLVVVGPVKRDEVLATANRTFGRLPSVGSPRPAVAAPGMTSTHVELVRPLSHAYLAMAWRGPDVAHADMPAVDLLVSILGQTRGSRLAQSLRERLGLVNTVSSGYSALEGAGLISVNAQFEARNLTRVEAAMLQEIRRLRSDGVSDTELRRAVTLARARRAFQTETSEGRASTFGQAETIWTLEDEMAYIDRVQRVSADQIRAVARRYLDPAHYARVVFVPQGPR